MKKRNYWDILTKDIFQNRLLMFFAVLTTVLCFGFTITNFSIGVDDPARDYYFYSSSSGNMIQQGRLLHLLLNTLTHSIEFIPFFSDFVGAGLFLLSALLFCALFQYISDGKFSQFGLIAFACTYISHSILAEKFIYQLDIIAIMLSYCGCALSLMYAYRFVKEKQLLSFLKATGILMVSIASYESFLFLYFCGVFALIIIDISSYREKEGRKEGRKEKTTFVYYLRAFAML